MLTHFERERERRKLFNRRKFGFMPEGVEVSCRKCSAAFIKRGRQVYCDPCRAKGVCATMPEFRARQNEKVRQRRQRDPRFATNERFRTHLRNSLAGEKAGRSWESLVGYTLDDLMRHLERQFVKGMGWENRHLWHIDHIVPLAAFPFATVDDEGFRAAWALSNLRPLWRDLNWRKNAMRTHLL